MPSQVDSQHNYPLADRTTADYIVLMAEDADQSKPKRQLFKSKNDKLKAKSDNPDPNGGNEPARWFWVVGVALGIAGIALMLVSERVHRLTSLESKLALAMGESMLIASILALTVDRFLKARLAHEIAHDVYYQALFGRCPDWYSESMMDALSPDLMTEAGDWSLCITPQAGAKSIRLDVKAKSSGQNRSSENVAIPSNWLLASVEGAPSSTFTYFRLVTDGRPTITIEEPEFELPSIQSRKEDGRAYIDVGKSHSAHIPPNARYDLEASATVYMGENDVFPMMNARPARATQFVVDHSAMPDHQFALRYFSGDLEPDGNSNHDRGIKRYHFPGVAHVGNTVLLILGSIARTSSEAEG